MSLFSDDKTHIKKINDLKKELKKTPNLTPEEEKMVLDRARREIHTSTGMSKKEFLEKVIRPIERNAKDKITRDEARGLRKL
ncbi:hypothetical protein A2W54_03265 [Candidatus Giovannonibacteria bacterium RIFCSPHIGHO2_02_43_13]|uniref:Uncharacterized protein n=1 Tax=Candidatus Giovannonibacteria bacterium RIFCSPHIGHO2_02_43_13 TaxID=1798330 RepID=A0A1F5WQ12_9BACT|nr:MAG: hypothetical protein UW28_C0014G0018 [Parcubacteria group bacterium GW2011_GWA2_44_13]OGF73015.1 MAG: hypothetical protein A3E06_00295 [Candidatus Giovannonibacteria bacterium RIFCSPHIGHO2_12_FULL_44_42]OGF77762.1 MAG: hypothetical protein A2W54_03265 [Candidatus Giovannonibacteria bacterium RIFCSPHIGHO2_02_43_13]OGF89445.1 MAG: hypothetical protein A3I94_01150 [Candidatus Giovannonibacteria bacterium RIFCSPLOWO2_02_FULL_43_54]OGF97111.1 MAG: hypothetical protein A3H08_03455 [Candidatus